LFFGCAFGCVFGHKKENYPGRDNGAGGGGIIACEASVSVGFSPVRGTKSGASATKSEKCFKPAESPTETLATQARGIKTPSHDIKDTRVKHWVCGGAVV